MSTHILPGTLVEWPLMNKLKQADIPKIKKFLVITNNVTSSMYAITTDDRVLAAGDNDFCQLGVGHMRPIEGAIEIRALRGKKVVDIVFATRKFYALTKYGEVWFWGQHGNRSDYEASDFTSRPQRLHVSGVVSLRCFLSMLMALTEDGRVYVWCERNQWPILAQLNSLPSGEIGVAIEGNDDVSYVLSQNGRVFVHDSVPSDELVNNSVFVFDHISEMNVPAGPVKAIACNRRHVVLITEKGEAYTCGAGLDPHNIEFLSCAANGAKFDNVYFVDAIGDEILESEDEIRFYPESYFILTDTNGLCYVFGRHTAETEDNYIIDTYESEMYPFTLADTIFGLSNWKLITTPIMLSVETTEKRASRFSNINLNFHNLSLYVPPNKLRQWPLMNRFDDDTLIKIKNFFIHRTVLMYAITTDDRVLAAGLNHVGQLGIGHKRNTRGFVEITRLHGKQVINIVTHGGLVFFALTRAGEVYSWGSRRTNVTGSSEGAGNFLFEPVKINLPSTVALKCGLQTIIARTSDGCLYYWGRETGGGFQIITEPQSIPLPPDEICVGIEAGYNHFWYLTQNGRAFGFGLNTSGQLGCLGPQNVDANTPQEFCLPVMGEKIKSIACGTFHTILITSTGRLYICGRTITKFEEKVRLLYPGDDDIRFERVYNIFSATFELVDIFVLITTNGECFVADLEAINTAGENLTFEIFIKIPSRCLFSDFLMGFRHSPVMLICQAQGATLQETSLVKFVHQPITIENCLIIYQWCQKLDLKPIKRAAFEFIYNNFQSINWTEEWAELRRLVIEICPDVDRRRAPKRKATQAITY